MAQMYPEWINEQERRRNPKLSAEYRVYDALRESLPGDKWYVFYSRTWNWVERKARRLRTREADFIIAHPMYGILILEVKGGKIEVIEGRWTSTDRNGRIWEIDPYDQVAIAAVSLERRLGEEKNNPFAGFRFSTAVCFPDVSLAECQQGPAADKCGITIDASQMSHLKDAVLVAMKDGEGDFCPPGEARILALKELIAHSWYVDVPKSVQVKETERHIKKLTEDQFKLMYDLAPSARRLVVSGCAGSGKTVMAAEIARRMVLLGNKKVLLSCFNKNLATWLRQSHYFVDNNSMLISNYHKLCADFATQAGLALPDIDEGTRQSHDPIFETEYPELLVQSAEKMGLRFDAIVVDEAQDFLGSWWTSLLLLLAEEGCMHVYLDGHQNLRGDASKLPDEITANAMTLDLTENVRNTKAIHDLAMTCHPSRGRKYKALCEVGVEPQYVAVEDGKTEHQALSALIDKLTRKDGVASADIAVLTPLSISEGKSNWRPGETLVGKFRLVHDLKPAPHEIFCSSVASAKGLEFPVVIMTEIDAEQESDSAFLQRMYVGLTRARSVLYVLTSEAKFREAVTFREAHDV